MRAGELPVWLEPTDGSMSATPAGRVRVEVLDRERTAALNLRGLLFRLGPAEGGSAAMRARATLDYAGFRSAFGAGYGSRLRVLRYPACALNPQPAADCLRGTPVDSRNDGRAYTISAEVTVDESGSVYAVTAAASGGGGSYAAQPLSPQAEWSATGGSGDLTWSYPLRLPPPPAGVAPDLSINYNSGVVDGQTAATNNQAGALGLGFDLGVGYIERRFASCAYNGYPNPDLCWKYDNAFLVLNGVATELLPGSGGVWYARNNPGWKIEKSTGGNLPGRDNDDERWQVTTPDGTRYHFGLSRQPATLYQTHSVWTVPVFALGAGAPCWTGSYATSHCEQAWRWNLDYIQDKDGNSTTYFWEEEGNFYGRNGDVYDQAYYIRGGSLIRIEYGTREYQENAGPAAQVVFGLKPRCAGGADSCGAPTPANAAKYPDVPVDRLCTNSQVCPNHAPTFFSIKRLNAITTYVKNPADLADGWQAVDSWDLAGTFYGDANDPTDPALILTNIKHSGMVGATPIVLNPGTWFDYIAYQNRVDVNTAAGSPALIRHRVRNIYDDFGSRIDVTYGQAKPCNAAATPVVNCERHRLLPGLVPAAERDGPVGLVPQVPGHPRGRD